MTSLYRYHAFGLDFQSAIALPEMRPGLAGRGNPVIIQLADAPCPAGLMEVDAGVAVGPQDFWMDVPDVGRLHVANGSRIKLDLNAGQSPDATRPYLLGSAIGALLYQRKILPLHASAIEIDGIAVAFCGASGAGKSSIAHAFVRRGHRLICDDIAAIDTLGPAPTLWPGLTTLKLWRESITAAGEETTELQPVLPQLDKYLRPVEALAANQGFQLKHVVVLAVSNGESATMAPLTASGSATMLVANSFRGQLVAPMRGSTGHFHQCVLLTRAARHWTLTRPWSHAAMPAACKVVEDAIKTS